MSSGAASDNAATRGPLSGIRVVEMGTLIAGPFCGQLLGDLGAEIIKIEPPGRGDPMRDWGQVKHKGRSYWWTVIARNKKSVTLNLREPAGQKIARELISTADVLIENFRPGTLEKWGLDWATLSSDNPGLVMVRVSGYGQTGPYARRAGFGAIGEAMGGLRYITGYPDRPSTRVGISIGDSLTATFGALGCLAALRQRDITGKGQVVDSALYESVLAMTESLVPEFCGEGHQRQRSGAVLPKIAPSNIYECSDGDSVLIAANQDTVFLRLCEAMEMPDLSKDSRFSGHTKRGEHQAEIDELVAAWASTKDANELLDILEAAGVPAGRVYQVKDMIADPHFAAREALIDVQTPGMGEVKMQNVVPKLSKTPGGVHSPAPELGQHTDEVLSKEMAFSPEALKVLREQNVI